VVYFYEKEKRKNIPYYNHVWFYVLDNERVNTYDSQI